MSEFGIYFGSKAINVTEVNKREVLTDVSISKARLTDLGTEQKITEESKIVTILKDEFRKNQISPSSVNLALSGDDLIIRTFELPMFLSRKELEYKAIAFEAKKYTPFKIDDLLFDFRLYKDQKEKKILVLFVGIKRDIFNKYLSIFKQLEVNVKLIEYAGFSILRFLRLAGLKDKGILGVLNVDLEEETNFLVCQNGFPLFSRDITLSSGPETESNHMSNLGGELRISLDFFRRKFRAKSLDKIIILSSGKFLPEMTTITKDLGLSVVPLQVSKFLGRETEFKGAFAKSYATAISNLGGLRFPINLTKPCAEKEEGKGLSFSGIPLSIAALKINSKAVLLACLIIGLSWGWGWFQRSPIERELNSVRMSQPEIENISGAQSWDSLKGLEQEYINKTQVMEELAKNRFYLTEAINIIPRLMPRGAWLDSFSFSAEEEKIEFSLQGMVYLGNADREFAAVNDIVLGLRNNPEFARFFKEINVASIEKGELKQINAEATQFKILCR